MRGIASYLLGGIVVALAMGFFSPPVWLGLAVGVGAWPVTPPSAATQVVDRTHKGDRLDVPTSLSERQAPTTPRAVMIGCDPPYSPLVASARAANPGRCVAEIGDVVLTG